MKITQAKHVEIGHVMSNKKLIKLRFLASKKQQQHQLERAVRKTMHLMLSIRCHFFTLSLFVVTHFQLDV
jgi:hypothetical protein